MQFQDKKTDEFMDVTLINKFIPNSPFAENVERFSVPEDELLQFPDEYTKDNIYNVFELVRYFGIDESNAMMYDVFKFLFKLNDLTKYNWNTRLRYKDGGTLYTKNGRASKLCYESKINLFNHSLRQEFPEYRELWKNLCPDMIENRYNIEKEFKPMQYAAENGLFFLLKYYIDMIDIREETQEQDICSLSCKSGSLQCLKYAHQHGYFIDSYSVYYSVKYGHVSCLKYSFPKVKIDGYYCSKLDEDAAEGGYLSCLKYLIKMKVLKSDNAVNSCIKNGHFECFKFLIESGYTLDDYSIKNMKNFLRIDMFKYCKKHNLV